MPAAFAGLLLNGACEEMRSAAREGKDAPTCERLRDSAGPRRRGRDLVRAGILLGDGGTRSPVDLSFKVVGVLSPEPPVGPLSGSPPCWPKHEWATTLPDSLIVMTECAQRRCNVN